MREAYARLTSSEIRLDNFRRWLSASPSGPALHAVLRTAAGTIAAHMALFPFPLWIFGRAVTAAKGEYFFVAPEYRRAVVRGCESAGQPPALILLQALYRAAREEVRWDPVFLNAPPGVDALHRLCGARSIAFPLTECLFVRRPWRAARGTPNLTRRQRQLLGLGGLAQAVLSAAYAVPRWGRASCLTESPLDRELPADIPPDRALFSHSSDYLRWRYPPDQFVRYQVGEAAQDHVIARRGSPEQYFRICAARLTSAKLSAFRLLTDLLAEAARHGALGLRWAVYDHGQVPAALVGRLRRLGVLAARRTRTIAVLTGQPELLAPSVWCMEDSLTAFEH